jgi:hypothetical protein
MRTVNGKVYTLQDDMNRIWKLHGMSIATIEVRQAKTKYVWVVTVKREKKATTKSV